MQIWPTKKIVSFPSPTQSRPAPVKCEVCGNPVHAGATCLNCGLRLIDLALASGADSDFEVVQRPLEYDAAPTPVARMRYAHYELCQRADGSPWELGRGGMGITYQAKDVQLGSLVALKIIAPGRLDGTKFTDRFLLEARTAARLRHPNIASIHHLGLQEDGCFYAMEYIEGESLEECIQNHGALPPTAALNLVLQCARGLSTAHGQGFIHRDLKPSNIMLMSTFHGADLDEPTVKLIDFGLAKAFEEETVSDNFCHGYFAGTPHYASPEQLAGWHVDARSDIYSLGMCLWFMLVGKVPVSNTTSDGQQIYPPSWTFLTAELAKRVPTPVLALVKSMISPEPGSRPQSASELIKTVQTCLSMLSRRRSSFRWIVLPVTVVAITAATFAARSYATNNHTAPATMPDVTQAEARALCAEGNEHRFKLTKQYNLQAIECYLKAIKLCPDFADAHAALASAYLQNVCRFNGPVSQQEDALASARRAIALDKNSPAGFTALGEILTVQGLHWEALAQFHRALELNAEFAPAMRGFSLLWSTVGQPQRGLAWAKAAVKIEPAQAVGWNAAAAACVDLCADEQAEKFYKRCLEINPVWIPAHCGLVHLHLLQGRFAQARQDYILLESIDSNLLLPLTLKAQIALFSGDYSEAELLYRRLLTMKREGFVHYFSSISYLSALGYLRCRAGDRLEGERYLVDAATLHLEDSEGPQAIYDLAAIRSIQGRTEEALGLLQQAISSGWMDYRATHLDPRFEALRGQTAFQQMLEALKGHVEQMKNESDILCLKPLSIADYKVKPSAD